VIPFLHLNQLWIARQNGWVEGVDYYLIKFLPRS